MLLKGVESVSRHTLWSSATYRAKSLDGRSCARALQSRFIFNCDGAFEPQPGETTDSVGDTRRARRVPAKHERSGVMLARLSEVAILRVCSIDIN